MQPTTGANHFSMAKAMFNAAQEGRLSEFDLNIGMQKFAEVYFDRSMSKFLDSELGKIFLAPRTLRKSVAEEAELLQKRAKPRNAPADDGYADDNDTESKARKVDAAIKALMKSGDSFDVAASKVHRALNSSTMNGANAGPNRPMNTGATHGTTGESINQNAGFRTGMGF